MLFASCDEAGTVVLWHFRSPATYDTIILSGHQPFSGKLLRDSAPGRRSDGRGGRADSSYNNGLLSVSDCEAAAYGDDLGNNTAASCVPPPPLPRTALPDGISLASAESPNDALSQFDIRNAYHRQSADDTTAGNDVISRRSSQIKVEDASPPSDNDEGPNLLQPDGIVTWSVMCFSSDGGLLACGGRRQTRRSSGDEECVGALNPGVIKLFDIAAGRSGSRSLPPGEELRLVRKSESDDDDANFDDPENVVRIREVTAIAWGPSTKTHAKGLLAFGDVAGSLRLWDPESRSVVKEFLVTPGRAVTLVTWHGSELAAGHSSFKDDGRPSSLVRVYRLDNFSNSSKISSAPPGGRWVEAKMLMPDMYICGAGSRDNSLFLSGYKADDETEAGHQVVVLDTATGSCKVLEPGSVVNDTGLKRHTCWSPCGKMLLNEAGNLWDVESGCLKTTIGPRKNGFRQHSLSSMSWSPNGTFLMTSPLGSENLLNRLRLWSMDESETQHTLPFGRSTTMSCAGSSADGPLNRLPGQDNGAHTKGMRITCGSWSPCLTLTPAQQSWLLSSRVTSTCAKPLCDDPVPHPASVSDKEGDTVNARTPHSSGRAPKIPATRKKGEKAKIEKEIHRDGNDSYVIKDFMKLIPRGQDSLLGDDSELEALLQFFGDEQAKTVYGGVRDLHTKQAIREVFERALGAPLKEGEKLEIDSTDTQCKEEVKQFVRKEFTSWRRALLFAYLLIRKLQERSRCKEKREENKVKLRLSMTDTGAPADSSSAAPPDGDRLDSGSSDPTAQSAAGAASTGPLDPLAMPTAEPKSPNAASSASLAAARAEGSARKLQKQEQGDHESLVAAEQITTGISELPAAATPAAATSENQATPASAADGLGNGGPMTGPRDAKEGNPGQLYPVFYPRAKPQSADRRRTQTIQALFEKFGASKRNASAEEPHDGVPETPIGEETRPGINNPVVSSPSAKSNKDCRSNSTPSLGLPQMNRPESGLAAAEDGSPGEGSQQDVTLAQRAVNLKRPRSPSAANCSDASSTAKLQKENLYGDPSDIDVSRLPGYQDPNDGAFADSDVEEDSCEDLQMSGSTLSQRGFTRAESDNSTSLQINLPESQPLEEDTGVLFGTRVVAVPAAAPASAPPAVYPKQEQVAKELLAKVQLQEKAAGSAFSSFAFYIQVPNLNSLLGQTITRVNEFLETHRQTHPEFFFGIEAKDIVYKGAKSTLWCAMFERIKKRILDEPDTMFLFVHDEAHWSPTPGTSGWFINDELLRTSPNVFTIFVSATPYNLLTRDSQIPVENEHHWFASNEETKYYGLQKYCASLSNNAGCLPGAIVQDKGLDASAHAVQLTDALRERFMTSRQTADGATESQTATRLKIKTLVALEMHYMSAFLQAMGKEPADETGVRQPNGQPLPTLPERDLTLQMVRKLVHPSSPDGRGVMVLVRVADQKSGKSLYNSLRSMRAYLGLQNKLGIIIDINQAEARDDTSFGLKETIEQPLLNKLLSWQQERGWVAPDATTPLVRQYSDLEDLPCVLILCEKGKMGDTFPKSLRYYDLRLRYISSCNERAATEQDLGRAFRYINESDPELPTILASVKLYQDLQSKRGGRVGLLKHDPSRADLMRCVKRGRGKECYPNTKGGHPEGDTSPYRKHWAAGPKHFDHGKLPASPGAAAVTAGSHQAWVNNPRRFALVAAPQIGKTGAFLHLIYLLWSRHAPTPGVPIAMQAQQLPLNVPKGLVPDSGGAVDEVMAKPEPEASDNADKEPSFILSEDDDGLPSFLKSVMVPLRGLSHAQAGRLVEHALNQRWGEAHQRAANHLAGQRVAEAGVDGTVLQENENALVGELKPVLVGRTRREAVAAAVAVYRMDGGVQRQLAVAWAEAPGGEPLPRRSKQLLHDDDDDDDGEGSNDQE